ncbi:MAG: SRPBCC domain-containing protein [Pseudomonadota bacterium]
MTDAPDIHIQTFIRATPEAIWEALTDASALEAHHFNKVKVAGLDGGGYALLDGEGNPFIIERILSEDHEKRLELSFKPSWTDVPGDGSKTVFEITQEPRSCKLVFEHFNCANIGIGDNWHRFTASLKSYLETGERLYLPQSSA